jgi:hypothetical protein
MPHQYTSNISYHIIVHGKKNFKNNLSHSYDIHFKFYFHRYILPDEMNKTRSHLHII